MKILRVGKGVAYHEAGHAVAALLCGEVIHSIKVRRKANDPIVDRHGGVAADALGGAEVSGGFGPEASMLIPDPGLTLPLMARALNRIFVTGAGIAAERKVAKQSRGFLSAGAEHDYEHACYMLALFGYNRQDQYEMVDEIWEATGPLIARGPAWQAVEAIAEAVIAGHGDDGTDLNYIGLASLGYKPASGRVQPVYVPIIMRAEYPQFEIDLAADWASIDAAFATERGV